MGWEGFIAAPASECKSLQIDDAAAIQPLEPRFYASEGLVTYLISLVTYLIFFVTPFFRKQQPALLKRYLYSTVTDFAKLRGWSTSVPLSTAT